jgi:protein involved in polysaccharide export with SLBB domain
MSDKRTWPYFMRQFDVGDVITVTLVDGEELTGTVQADGSLLGEPEFVVADDLTLTLLVAEENDSDE